MTTRQKIIKVCDALWSRLVRLRANGRCQACGAEGGAAHHAVIRRSYLATRWHPDNGILLCFSCHRKAHDDHEAGVKIALRSVGWERIDYLKNLSRQTRVWTVVDIAAVKDNLEKMIAMRGEQ